MKRLLLALPLLAGFACLNPVSIDPAPNSEIAARLIGSAGGTLDDAKGGLRIEVPPGALDHLERITVQEDAAVPPGSLGQQLGPVYRLGPSGLTFAKPLLVTFLNPVESPLARVYLASDDFSQVELLPEKRSSAGALQGEVGHFSKVGIILPPSRDAGEQEPVDAGAAVVDPSPCQGSAACAQGCLGDSSNCSACGDVCQGICDRGTCRPSGFTRVHVTKGKLTQVSVTPDGHIYAPGWGLWGKAPGESAFRLLASLSTYFYGVWANGSGVVMGTTAEPPFDRATLWRSTDFGATWLQSQLPLEGGGELVRGAGGELWCFGGKKLYRSRDQGASFTPVAANNPDEDVISVWIAPFGEIFAMVWLNQGGYIVSRALLISADGGATFARIPVAKDYYLFGSAANDVYAVADGLYRLDVQGRLSAVATFPATATGLARGWTNGTFVAVSSMYPGTVYLSRDSGVTWLADYVGGMPLGIDGTSDASTVAVADVLGDVLWTR